MNTATATPAGEASPDSNVSTRIIASIINYRNRSRMLSLVVIVIFLAFSLFPVYWVVMTALRTQEDIFNQPVLLQPVALSLVNINYVLFGSTTNDPIIRFFFTSLIIASVTTLASTAMGVMCAYGLVRYETGGAALKNWFLSQRFLPPIAIMVPLFIIYKNLGLLDTYPGLILLHVTVTVPLAVWLMLGHMQTLPPDFEEAALVEGATRWQAFIQVVVPLVSPGIAITAMFTFIASWNEYLFSYQLAGNNVSTITVYIPRLRSAIALLFGQVAAASLLSLIPSLAFAWVLQRYLVHGLFSGGTQDV
jgi:multiple sugar transport system permease protein